MAWERVELKRLDDPLVKVATVRNGLGLVRLRVRQGRGTRELLQPRKGRGLKYINTCLSHMQIKPQGMCDPGSSLNDGQRNRRGSMY
jgi:hypothetical protein